MHIYCHKKRTFSQKLCSHVIFSTFFVKTLPLSCIHLVKKCQFCQNYNILWAKKSKKITLFLRFFTKKTATLIPIFVKKSSILLKPRSHAHILLKNVHSLKYTVFSFHFWNFSMKNPLLSCTYFVQKTSILSKKHIKKVNRIPFFCPIFHGKINVLIPIFC